MTFPSALKERLILAASFMPYSLMLVLLCRSEPARSTKFNLPTLNFGFPKLSIVCYYILMLKMQCDLEDSLFMGVCLTERFLYPILKYLYKSSTDLTRKVLSPSITSPLLEFSLRLILALVSSPNKS